MADQRDHPDAPIGDSWFSTSAGGPAPATPAPQPPTQEVGARDPGGHGPSAVAAGPVEPAQRTPAQKVRVAGGLAVGAALIAAAGYLVGHAAAGGGVQPAGFQVGTGQQNQQGRLAPGGGPGGFDPDGDHGGPGAAPGGGFDPDGDHGGGQPTQGT